MFLGGGLSCLGKAGRAGQKVRHGEGKACRRQGSRQYVAVGWWLLAAGFCGDVVVSKGESLQPGFSGGCWLLAVGFCGDVVVSKGESLQPGFSWVCWLLSGGCWLVAVAAM